MTRTEAAALVQRVNDAALPEFYLLLERWLPDGRLQGREFVARNPRRDDRRPGSFKVNILTGAWADFATDDRGSDPVSFTAYLFDLRQVDAARFLARAVGVNL